MSDTLESMTRVFHAACADLGAINEALGLNADDGGAEPILMAIEALKLRAKYAETDAPAGYFINDAAEGAPPHFSQIMDGSESEPDVFPLYVVAAPPVPEGFVLVPLQPTQRMCQAGQDKAREWPRFPLRIAPIWQAMIAAVDPDAYAQPSDSNASTTDDALTRELLQTLQATLRHFTKTPSTLADSLARGKAHEIIGKAYTQLGYDTPSADACQTCSGRGEIGGFVNAENGYQSDPCPDCTRADAESDEPRYRVMKASGSRYAYVIDTLESGSKGRYDVLNDDGWAKADRHAAKLNEASTQQDVADGGA